MKFNIMLSALVAMLAACACAVALPGLSATDIAKRADDATQPTLDGEVLGYLSSWFGWNLAGAAKDTNELIDGCQNLNSTGGKKWSQIGLVAENIRQPLCNASHSSPDPNEAFPNSIPSVTRIIERQLVGSFKGTEAFGYLCDNLAWYQINQLYLTDEKLFSAVCAEAGRQVPPRPFGTDAGLPLPEAAGFAARNTASILYATILAAGAETGPQLNILCAHAPNHIANLDVENLNGTLVQSTICDFRAPPSVDEAQSAILSWTSRLFITVLENIGNVDGWVGWLCQNLNVEGMNNVGLIGSGSKDQLCSDAKTGLPTELALPEGIDCDGLQQP